MLQLVSWRYLVAGCISHLHDVSYDRSPESWKLGDAMLGDSHPKRSAIWKKCSSLHYIFVRREVRKLLSYSVLTSIRGVCRKASTTIRWLHALKLHPNLANLGDRCVGVLVGASISISFQVRSSTGQAFERRGGRCDGDVNKIGEPRPFIISVLLFHVGQRT